MRGSAHTPGTVLWREVVERLDEGVIVFSDRGVAIYANDEAARLLAYPPRDVLELDKSDFVSLCQPDRLDGAQFAAAFLADDLPDVPDRSYDVATASLRLRIVPFMLHLEHGSTTILLLRESAEWRSGLIGEALISPEMQSSLAFASSTCQTLIARLESGQAYPFELLDLARIIQNGVGRAHAVWETLARLYATDPLHGPRWELEPLPLAPAVEAAIQEITWRSVRPPEIQLDLPPDLPPVAAAGSHLHAALCALLEGASERLARQEHLTLSARLRLRYVQVDLMPSAPGGLLHGYAFDSLPLAIVEQVIMRHGGRLWLRAQDDRATTVSFSLPVWAGERTAADTPASTA